MKGGFIGCIDANGKHVLVNVAGIKTIREGIVAPNEKVSIIVMSYSQHANDIYVTQPPFDDLYAYLAVDIDAVLNSEMERRMIYRCAPLTGLYRGVQTNGERRTRAECGDSSYRHAHRYGDCVHGRGVLLSVWDQRIA